LEEEGLQMDRSSLSFKDYYPRIIVKNTLKTVYRRIFIYHDVLAKKLNILLLNGITVEN
jgi:hypothetical protein